MIKKRISSRRTRSRKHARSGVNKIAHIGLGHEQTQDTNRSAKAEKLSEQVRKRSMHTQGPQPRRVGRPGDMATFNRTMGTQIWEYLADIPPDENPAAAHEEFEPVDLDLLPMKHADSPIEIRADDDTDFIDPTEGGYLLPGDPVHGHLFDRSLEDVSPEERDSVLAVLAWIFIDNLLSHGMTLQGAASRACIRFFPREKWTRSNIERLRQLWLYAKRKEAQRKAKSEGFSTPTI